LDRRPRNTANPSSAAPSKVSVAGFGTAKLTEKKNGTIEKTTRAPVKSVSWKLAVPGIPVKSR
jgi:hypothetical protein